MPSSDFGSWPSLSGRVRDSMNRVLIATWSTNIPNWGFLSKKVWKFESLQAGIPGPVLPLRWVCADLAIIAIAWLSALSQTWATSSSSPPPSGAQRFPSGIQPCSEDGYWTSAPDGRPGGRGVGTLLNAGVSGRALCPLRYVGLPGWGVRGKGKGYLLAPSFSAVLKFQLCSNKCQTCLWKGALY